MLIGLLEADELIMKTITSIARRDYIIKFKSGAELRNNRRSDKRGIIAKMTKLGKVLDEDYTLELETTYGDINLAISLVEKQLRKLYKMTGCDRIDLWLGPTDGSNFRFKSAKTVPYKSNRAPKPEIVTLLRNYLINFKGAQVIYGYEADDALGIYQKSFIEAEVQSPYSLPAGYNSLTRKHGEGISLHRYAETVAIHYDKDIYMIPGLHYDTIKDKFIEVDELGSLELVKGALKGTGLAFFYAQMLLGDRTDTIPPLQKGKGAVWAYKQLEDIDDEESYLQLVVDLFQAVIVDNWQDRLLEQADLVWICRNKEEKGSDYIERRYLELFGGEL